jgi:Cu(I)/Ag(I) efflux system membrane fusion protein
VGEVFQSDAARIEVGDPVTMTSNYLPGKSWEGHVDYIYPSLDETTNTLRFRTRIDNPGQRLKVNMFAQLAIHQKSAEQTLLIPREALIRTGHQNRAVLALGEGRFKSVEVEVGRVGTHKAEILEGLKAGDRIATSAQFLLDSESSKTSDFQRMHHGEKATPGQGKGDGDGAMKSMDHSSQGD